MRSLLFVPGDRPERFAKACASAADAVIIDLEDAVAPSAKTTAREALAAWLGAEHCPVLVRINAPGTPWHADDMAVLGGMPGVRGIVLPKAERVNEVANVAVRKPVFPLIETALGLRNAADIAAVAGVQRLLFGSIDFQLDLGIGGEGLPLLFFRSQLVWISRLAGLPAPIDGVSLALDDASQLQSDAAQARALGFGGKLCIHPRQAAAVNEAFSPSAKERSWARRVLEAATRAQGAAVQLDGQMIDRPIVLRAEAIAKESELQGMSE